MSNHVPTVTLYLCVFVKIQAAKLIKSLFLFDVCGRTNNDDERYLFKLLNNNVLRIIISTIFPKVSHSLFVTIPSALPNK